MTFAPEDPDSRLAYVLIPALILNLAEDRIVAANAQAARLFETPVLHGCAFAPFLDGSVSDIRLFFEEVLHRGTAWTRSVALKTAIEKSLEVEIRSRRIDQSDTLLMLAFLDLDEMEIRARRTEDAKIQRGGLMEWQRAQVFFSELERQNQLILNAAGEGIYGVNADGKTTFVNRAAQEMLGWTAEDLLGRDIHSMIHHHHLNGDHYPSHDCPIYHSFRHEEVSRTEDEVFWRKDGKPIRVEYVSTPIYDHIVLAGAVVIFRDVTQRKENERRLREAMDEVAALRDKLEQENTYLQEAISIERAHHDIVGVSPATQALLARVELVSRTSANVLITGEPGTGKSLVASAIHKDSDRRRRPIIHFHCGSASNEMMEDELFGHVRGGSINALKDKAGSLELANGGTLFLDEITEIPLEQQGRLLNALQSGFVSRQGETRKREINVRIIAATNKDLKKEIAEGNFREDLYHRLNVIPIYVPALADRKEDIPLLAEKFLSDIADDYGDQVKSFSNEAMDYMVNLPWTGNVRELRNVVERLVIMCDQVISVDEVKLYAGLGL